MVRGKLGLAITIFLVLFLISVAPATAATFSGRVFQGAVGDESIPVPGVTVSLYCASRPVDAGDLVTSTVTNGEGWYSLTGPDSCYFLSIIETVPRGISAIGATTVDGVVVSSTWIRYSAVYGGKTLTGNKFWLSGGGVATTIPTLGPIATITPSTCPGGCECLLEEVAAYQYGGQYEQCSEVICGYDGRLPMYCWRPRETEPIPATCLAGCVCVREEAAAEMFGTFELCTGEICGYDERIPLYCYRAAEALPARCPEGCTCMMEEEAVDVYGDYERCSEEICGYEGRTAVYCYRPREAPPIKTCPAGCVCVREEAVAEMFGTYEQCSGEICGYDERIPLYCFRAMEAPPTEIQPSCQGECEYLTEAEEVSIHQNFPQCGDGACSHDENTGNCPEDCPAGGIDDYCDGREDEVCDPDCVGSGDPDCKYTAGAPGFGTGIAIAGLFILLLFRRRRK